MKQQELPIAAIVDVKPEYNIKFFREDGTQCGEVNWTNEWWFEGDVDESVQVFFDHLCMQGNTYNQTIAKLQDELEAAKTECLEWKEKYEELNDTFILNAKSK